MFNDHSDENPLAGLGSTSAAIASVSTSPGPVPADRPRRRRSETPLVLLWALLTLAIGAYVLQRSEHAAVHDPIQRAARGQVGDTSHDSLVRPANTAHVLRALRGAMRPGETLSSLRLDPAKASADVRDGDGNKRILDVDLAYHVDAQTFGTTSFPGTPLSSLDPAGPARLLAAVKHRAPGAKLDYVVVDVGLIDHKLGLNMFVTGTSQADHQWMADIHGRHLHRPGEAGAAVAAKAAAAAQITVPKAQIQQIRHALRLAGRSPSCLRHAHTLEALQGCND